MSDEAKGVLERLNLAEKLVALGSAIALLWTTFQANTTSNAVAEQSARLDGVQRQQEIALKGQEALLARRDADTTLTHTIYKEFILAITDRSTPDEARLDRLSAVLVLAAAIPDPVQRQGMAEAIKSAIDKVPVETPIAVERAAGAAFDADTVIASAGAELRTLRQNAAAVEAPSETTSTPRWRNYDFDVFWCDGVARAAENSRWANDIAALRASDPAASGRWQVRALPSQINERAGYRVSGLVIRYSSPDELGLAMRLKSEIENRFPDAAVEVLATTQSTPWYLSVFACVSA